MHVYVYLYFINYLNQKKTLVRKIIYPDIILSFFTSSLYKIQNIYIYNFIYIYHYMRYILYRHKCINIQIIADKQTDCDKTISYIKKKRKKG